MASLRDKNKRHDKFFKKAREGGYAARSVFKLEEIDKKFRLLRPGERVLDLGCRPGSWLKYAAGVVGRLGTVIGLDRAPLPAEIPGARALVGDVFTITDEELLGDLRAFDAVLSDMAPDTIGVRSPRGLFEPRTPGELADTLVLANDGGDRPSDQSAGRCAACGMTVSAAQYAIA